MLYKARDYVSKKCLANLYHTYIYPYFIYCIEIWGGAVSCHLHPLVLLQKKIVRIITFSYYLAHSEPLFIDLSILPFDKMYFNRISIFMYKQSNGLLPNVMNELYISKNEIHKHNTRHSVKLYISKGSDKFSTISARVWNLLSSLINVNVSLNKFKVNSKYYFLHNSLRQSIPNNCRVQLSYKI